MKLLNVGGAESKVSWAKEVLKRSMRSFDVWAANDLVMTALVDPQIISQKWLLHVKSSPPNEVILGFGDVFSNLRSALDYIAWELYSISGGPADHSDARRIYFPIASDPVDFNRQRKSKLKGVWSEALDLARSMQDYELEVSRGCSLQNLEALCNSQKHRSLNIISVAPDFEATYRGGHWTIGEGERLIVDVPRIGYGPINYGRTYTICSFWIEEESEEGREKPLPRNPELNYPLIDPPIRKLAVTDGKNWILVEDIFDLVNRVSMTVSEFSKLPAPPVKK